MEWAATAIALRTTRISAGLRRQLRCARHVLVLDRESQRQLYTNIVMLIFRFIFDRLNSFRLRILGHVLLLRAL